MALFLGERRKREKMSHIKEDRPSGGRKKEEWGNRHTPSICCGGRLRPDLPW